jgi:hypothetical protein
MFQMNIKRIALASLFCTMSFHVVAGESAEPSRFYVYRDVRTNIDFWTNTDSRSTIIETNFSARAESNGFH